MHVATVLFWVAWIFILYTYCLFPVLLAAYARIFGRQPASPQDRVPECLPRVAMVVAAYNEKLVMPAKLANTCALDYPKDRFQLLVGCDGSADGTGELLEASELPWLRCFRFPVRRGKISVLNDLVAHTNADIIVMSDANTMFAPDAVRTMVRHFQNPKVGCVSGELLLEQDGGVSGEGLYWRYEGWIKRSESRLGFLIGCNGGIFALRKELYEPLPSSTVVEDFVLTLRVLEMGREVRFEPDARGIEPPAPTARAEMVRKIRIGAGGFQALGLTSALLHPRYGRIAFAFWGHKLLRWFVPFFLLIGLCANAALATLPGYREFFVLQMLGAMVAFWVYNLRPGKSAPRWTRPISYFYLMNYALFQGFFRFVFGTQRVTWERAAHTPAVPATASEKR